MNKVYLVKCTDYDQADEKITELLSLMGGVAVFAKSAEKLVLKVNLLLPSAPDRAATTHPAVVSAVAKQMQSAGARAVIADSPGSGYPHNQKTFEKLYQLCEMDQAAESAGAELNVDPAYASVFYPEGRLIKRFEIIQPVLDADGVINLCKLKTHGFTAMTGAIKNSFGVIPGLTKPGYHAKLRETSQFASMLLDLSAYVTPRLSIMDAVVGMEGNGPNGGTPRKVGYLIGAENPLALDVVAGEIIGIPFEKNPVLVEAEKRGLAPTRIEQIELIGAEREELRIPDYKLPATLETGRGFDYMSALRPIFKNAFTVKPKIIRKKCVACGACRDACPVHVITISPKKYAIIDRKNCIRCYCCHEMCPHDAIDLHAGLFFRMANFAIEKTR